MTQPIAGTGKMSGRIKSKASILVKMILDLVSPERMEKTNKKIAIISRTVPYGICMRPSLMDHFSIR